MNEEIYRKKSLDKIKSPENLDDYIRVTNPGVWLLLLSVIILLAGACIWGALGHVDSTVPSAVLVENGEATCCIARESISSVQAGLTVKFADCEAVITEVRREDGEADCVLRDGQMVPDGFYEGKIVTNSVKPLSFILN